MATKQIDIQQDLIITEALEAVAEGYAGFGAKADGLYQKLPGEDEQKILSTNDYWTGTEAELEALDLITARIPGKFYYVEEA